MDNQILSNALLGTARHPYQPGSAEEGLGDLLQSLGGESSEEALLGAIAASQLFEKAGFTLSVTTDSLPEPAQAETLRPCSPRSQRHLETLLKKRHYEILREWLAAMAQAPKRVSSEKLPEMFGLMEKDATLISAIEPVLGERGKWLARQNPAWNLLTGQNLEAGLESWETGTQAHRVAFLRRLRANDSDQARTLLSETWSTEGADQRAALLGTFEQSLSPADEPFLEEKLNDRSKEVRRTAAELLARLPGSAFVGRMIARANQAIQYIPPKKGLFNLGSKGPKTAFQVTPFDKADPSMLRDGIEPKSSSQTMGDKAYMLNQIVSNVPPGYWFDHWQVNPHALFREAIKSEYSEALIRGWRAALNRYPHNVWAEVFNLYWLSNYDTKLKDYFKPVLTITYPQFEELVFEALKKDAEPLYDRHPATILLLSYESGNWQPELVRAVVKSIRRRIVSNQSYQYVVQRQALKALTLHTPPGMAEELSDGWPEDSGYWGMWAKEVQEFLSLLELRNEMLKEIFS